MSKRKRLTREQRLMYASFAQHNTYCWNCGWTGYPTRDWCWAWFHNAHIIGASGRTHDRRNLVRLCHGCHLLAHGAAIPVSGRYLPTFDRAGLLWLKREYDAAYFDLDYLQTLAIGRLPEPVEPDRTWALEGAQVESIDSRPHYEPFEEHVFTY